MVNPSVILLRDTKMEASTVLETTKKKNQIQQWNSCKLSMSIWQTSDEGTNEESQEMLGNIPNIVFEHDNSQLVKEITEEEIAKGVWDMDPHKDLGPDEFSIRFYLSFWVTIK